MVVDCLGRKENLNNLLGRESRKGKNCLNCGSDNTKQRYDKRWYCYDCGELTWDELQDGEMSKMNDICVYTKTIALLHKIGALDNDCESYYWNLNKKPKKIGKGSKIYFAVEKNIRGYFIVNELEDFDDAYVIEWRSDSWKPLDEPIECKPFQGFKYMNDIEK